MNAEVAPVRAIRIEGELRGPGAFVVPRRSDPTRGRIVELVWQGCLYCYCIPFDLHGDCRHAQAARAAYIQEYSQPAPPRPPGGRTVAEIAAIFSNA